MSDKIFEIKFAGLRLKGDMAIMDSSNLILISCYGSESLINALFATVGMGNTIEIGNYEAYKNYWSHIRLKKVKIGYGKYHGIIYSDRISNYLIIFPGESLIDAYRRYLDSKPIPVLDEWIPELHEIFLKKKVFVPLTGINVKAYTTYLNEDSICDTIVENLKILKVSSLKQAANQ